VKPNAGIDFSFQHFSFHFVISTFCFPNFYFSFYEPHSWIKRLSPGFIGLRFEGREACQVLADCVSYKA
jgi:hypothetical protein